MTTSRLFPPPPPRSGLPWLTIITLAIACVVGTIMMSHFIDTLHLQMARGDALRVTQRMFGVSDIAAGDYMRVAQRQLPQSTR